MFTRCCALLLLVCASLWPLVSHAEGDPFLVPEQNAPLRLLVPGAGGWTTQCTALEPYAGIIYPGQAVKLSVEVKNTSKDATLAGVPTLEIVRFGSKLEKEGGLPSDFFTQGHLITYVPLGDPVRAAQPAISLKPGEKTTLTWAQANPDDFALFGTYIVIVDIAGVGRQAAATFARCHPYNVKDTGDGKGSPLFWSLHHVDRSGQLKIAAAAGYRWIRTDGFPNWHEVDQQFPRLKGAFDWTNQEKAIDEYRKLGLWIQSNMYGSPFGSITEKNWKTYNYVHESKYDYRWGDFVEEAVRRYCGPDGSGPLQIIDYWNEPWEGGGISAWKSDSIRYRQLYKILHERAHKGSPHILVGAASSIMNSEDKFMTVANWQDTYTLDILTDHYVQPYCSFGPRVAKQLGVTSIETETWIGFDEHQIVGVATHFMAAGQNKVNCNHPVQLTWRNGDGGGWMPKPVIMGANAFLYFVGARPFTRIVFHNQLPWLYQYGSDKDAVFVLSGDRRLLNPAAIDMFNQIHPNGTITLDAAGGKLKVCDVYGNAVAAQNGAYRLALARDAYFLHTTAGDAATVVEAVKNAKIEGIRPVQLFLQDFTTPMAPGATLAVDVHNVLNRPITGTLAVTPPAGCTVAAAETPVTLAAGEMKRITVALKTARANAVNAYPFAVAFTADGTKATLDEVLHVNAITRGTPTIDGNLADWAKTIPVLVHGAALKRDATTAAWRPWEAEKDVQSGLAEVRFQYDDANLYLAVRERSKGFAPKSRLSIDPQQNDCFGTGDMAHTYVKGFEAACPYIGHCLQIGFDVTDFRILPPLPTVPERMIAREDTDYEYSVWAATDGGSEIWRSVTPRMKFFHFLPRCMPAGYDGVPHGAKTVVRRVGEDTIYEVAIPLSDMPELRAMPGKEINIALRLPASNVELGFGRSATRSNGLTLLPRWEVHASNDVRWAFGQ
jgi:hypothetical protein